MTQEINQEKLNADSAEVKQVKDNLHKIINEQHKQLGELRAALEAANNRIAELVALCLKITIADGSFSNDARKAQQAPAQLESTQDQFCDSHCTWRDHHAECDKAQPQATSKLPDLESRDFYEIMYAYRHTPMGAATAFGNVKNWLRNPTYIFEPQGE